MAGYDTDMLGAFTRGSRLPTTRSMLFNSPSSCGETKVKAARHCSWFGLAAALRRARQAVTNGEPVFARRWLRHQNHVATRVIRLA